MRDPLEQAATPDRLRAALAAAGASETTTLRALAVADATPSRREWASFLSAALLLLGAALVLAGVISFFAFNWATLGRFGKFALIEVAIAACAIAGWRYRDVLGGRVALFAASVLVGALLAVFGQTYQTGADPWGLFAAWAFLITPWALAACFTPLWLLLIALIDAALILFWTQAIDPGRYGWVSLCIVIALVHAAFLSVWEWQRTRPAPWLADTWGPRLVLVGGFGALLVPSLMVIVDIREAGQIGAIAFALLLASCAAATAFYFTVRRDLFMLTAVAGTVFAIVTTGVGRFVIAQAPDIGAFFLLTMFIVVEIGLLVAGLRRVQQIWAEREA